MKAVLLAAGKSTRTYPLTTHCPKPLLQVLGKEILAYTIEGNMETVSQWYVVLGFEADQIKEFLKNRYPTLIFHFIEQPALRGTGEALTLLREELLGEPFLVLNADDLYHPEDIKELVESKEKYAVLGATSENPSRFGVLRTQGDSLIEIVEKPKEFISNLVNMGVYKFHGDMFSYTLSLSPRGEYEIIEYINLLLRDGEEVFVIPMKEYWLPITYPWDILNAQRTLLERGDVRNIIPTDAVLHSTAVIGQNVVLGAYCEIGENVELENVCLMDGVKIGNHVRLEGCVIGKNCRVKDDTIADGMAAEVCMLPIAGQDLVEIDPPYKGIFTEEDMDIEGFYLTPTFLTK